MSSPEKKPFHVPHQLVILFAIAVLATLATYVVPAGTYNTVTVNGRKVIDATTFHYIAQTPVSPWQAFLALPGGFTKQVGIIAMIMMIAGAISIINETKCIDASIGRLVSKYKNNLYVIIPLLLGVFTLLGAMGINTPIIAFVPVALILNRSLSGDAMLGVSLVLMGLICGLGRRAEARRPARVLRLAAAHCRFGRAVDRRLVLPHRLRAQDPQGPHRQLHVRR